MSPQRCLVIWLPDWPLHAAFGRAASGPVAVTHGNLIVACSAAARAQGVQRGQRKRLAQARAPLLQLLPADPRRDERAFLPVLRLLESLSPGVQLLRPGLAALRSRGTARFYGGEAEAGRMFLAALAAHDHPEARVGVADGMFTAEMAAQSADPVCVVPPGESARFLAPLPVQALSDASLPMLLERLGIRTLGDFAQLAPNSVRDRFGEHGVRLQTLAAGGDSRPVTPSAPIPDLAREVVFESALTQSDQVAFAVRQTADAVLAGLATASAVCTEVRIDLTDDEGAVNSRTWLHPTCFDAADLVDRVRWQLESLQGEIDQNRISAGITEVRITPVQVDDVAHHQPGLFGQGPHQRMHHAISRVQAMLGHRGVGTPEVTGGRWLAQRQQLIPWSDRVVTERDPMLPWPGHLPTPLPSEVFDPPRPVRVSGAAGVAVTVDERGRLSSPLALINDTEVISWAGPWPIRERRWDPSHARLAHRFQVVDATQRAWLLFLEHGQWWAEGMYR